MSWENQFLPYANNKGADHPAHPRSLISTFFVRFLDSIIPPVSISEISSLYLASMAAQAGWSLTWSETQKTGFLMMWLKCNAWGSLAMVWQGLYGLRQTNWVLIAYESSEGSGEPAYPCSLARTSAARSYRHWVKRNLQTESQIPSPSEWLGMHS